MTTYEEAREVFDAEITKYADAIRDRLDIDTEDGKQPPAVPMALLVAEAVKQNS